MPSFNGRRGSHCSGYVSSKALKFIYFANRTMLVRLRFLSQTKIRNIFKYTISHNHTRVFSQFMGLTRRVGVDDLFFTTTSHPANDLRPDVAQFDDNRTISPRTADPI